MQSTVLLAAVVVHFVAHLIAFGGYALIYGSLAARREADAVVILSCGHCSAEMVTVAGWGHYDADRRDGARRFADAVHTANAPGDGIAPAHTFMNERVDDLNTPDRFKVPAMRANLRPSERHTSSNGRRTRHAATAVPRCDHWQRCEKHRHRA